MAMAARAASLAICALLALCLVPHAVSRTNPGAAAVPDASSVSSEQGNPYPCDNVFVVRFPHGRKCERSYCGGLCVELFLWKYPAIKAVNGDCTNENEYECVCSFLC
ncbi:unnamed protein product [Alopecurus aequalis]